MIKDHVRNHRDPSVVSIVDECLKIVVRAAVAHDPSIGGLDSEPRSRVITEVIVPVVLVDWQELDGVDTQRLNVIELFTQLDKVALFGGAPGEVAIITCPICPVLIAASHIGALEKLVDHHLAPRGRAMPGIGPLEPAWILID
jgi:hypothetical protein